jgi:hypothetical protein
MNSIIKKNKQINKINADFNVEIYVKQFNVMGIDHYVNCDNLSRILYAAILNKFKVTLSEEEYNYFKEFQERIFDLVENLRELGTNEIVQVFDYFDKENHYLSDIVIMMWCMPRTDNFLSKRFYDKKYKENISEYNKKITDIIDHHAIKKFCIETLSKTNNVPIHCIDYIWFYMNTLHLEFSFYNSANSAYIGFTMPEDKDDYDCEEYIDFGFNMTYLLEMGLGQIVYKNDPGLKNSFRNLIKNIVLNPIVVEKMLTMKTRHNYKLQMENIINNPNKYFNDISDSQIDVIKSVLAHEL